VPPPEATLPCLLNRPICLLALRVSNDEKPGSRLLVLGTRGRHCSAGRPSLRLTMHVLVNHDLRDRLRRRLDSLITTSANDAVDALFDLSILHLFPLAAGCKKTFPATTTISHPEGSERSARNSCWTSHRLSGQSWVKRASSRRCAERYENPANRQHLPLERPASTETGLSLAALSVERPPRELPLGLPPGLGVLRLQ
jgi:hypothetical protein